MPRTIESILACHQVATALLEQGKPTWAATFDFSGMMPQGVASPISLSDEQTKELSKRYAALIRRHWFVKKYGFLDIESDDFNDDLNTVVENLECVGLNEDMTCLQTLNEAVDQLYDWADRKRVWVTGLGQ